MATNSENGDVQSLVEKNSNSLPANKSRRHFGKLLGLAAMAAPLAGCLGGGGGDDDDNSNNAPTGTTGSCATTSRYAISSDAKVAVTGGTIQGVNLSTGVRAFLGVPFAAPPVGNLRWKAPQAVVAWSGVKATQTNPPAAIKQTAPIYLSGMATAWPASEDCLYLNMWVPQEATASTGCLPVMVWMHGGGGNISETRYMGDELAKKGIIYIMPARRQGVFGNLALAGLSAETENKGSSGNFDMLDMIAALKWVQENIAKFGGDPNNVTLSGQSQGSVYATMLQASPLAKGLFKRVFTEAGYMFKGATTRTTGTTLAAAEANGAAWMAKFGTITGTTAATSVADLRAKTTAEIYLVTGTTFASEVIDNYVFPDTVTNLFLDGKQSDVPVYTGWCLLDAGATVSAVTDLTTYNSWLSSSFGSNASTVFNLYPAFNNTDAVTQSIRVLNDKANGMRNISYARIQNVKGTSPTYVYRFDRGNSVSPAGAKHGWDVPYWHGKLTAPLGDNSLPYQTAADYELTEVMMDSLVAFCKTSDPNVSKLTVPKYVRNDEKMTLLDASAMVAVPVGAGIDWFADNATSY